jgi:hypothetical protein
MESIFTSHSIKSTPPESEMKERLVQDQLQSDQPTPTLPTITDADFQRISTGIDLFWETISKAAQS